MTYDLCGLLAYARIRARQGLRLAGARESKPHTHPWPSYLGEVGVTLANEAFTLVELPLPRKEPVHLSCLPGPASALPSRVCPLLSPSPSPSSNVLRH